MERVVAGRDRREIERRKVPTDRELSDDRDVASGVVGGCAEHASCQARASADTLQLADQAPQRRVEVVDRASP